VHLDSLEDQIKVENLGLIDYGDAWRHQLFVHNEVASGESERLLICEHPKVITLGRVTPAEDILDTNVPVFEVERGGKATMHLPGQIVVYPIIDLNKRGKDLRGYLRAFEKAVIECLARFEIKGRSIRGKTGVWVGTKKIASIGVAVRKWVTFHGVAFNVNCRLRDFYAINPCGFSASVMTSVEAELRALGKEIPPNLYERVQVQFIDCLQKTLREVGSPVRRQRRVRKNPEATDLGV